MSSSNSRRMIYPYTITAKLVQFPFKFYYKNNFFFKYYTWAVVLSFPFFYKVQQIVCSEANYANLHKYREKERKELEHHREHML